ncbi:hypothetical protein [Desulfoferula mesophila]|uniref:N-acetyltransferase domain-containing protein n=1 Tax=Desulfoferula mesophila TaxID=3058419 RepID=A0AAU9EYT4_9BACT|nr:hypothetical protein FAK_37410 [Desulfoferula mesophilus]
MRILVVNPPLGGAAAAPCAAQWAAQALRGLEPLAVWDANRDFWNQRLLGGPRAEAARVWQGPGFYDPALYLRARRALKEGLAQAEPKPGLGSYGFAGLGLPEEADLESLLELARDESHPLHAWAQENLERRLPPESQALVLLALDVPGQCLGAAVMGLWLKKHRPQAVVAWVGECLGLEGAPTGSGPAWDHVFSSADPGPLRALAASLLGQGPDQSADPSVSAPSFSGPLSPAPVVALDLEAGEGPASLAQAISRAAAQEAGGALITNRELPATYLEALAPALKGNPLPLGLAASLSDPPSAQVLTALFQGGTRLIQWRAASGGGPALEQVSQGLLAASRAGLWNHLRLPLEGSGDWAQALLDFVGSNPHTVHSWSRPVLWPWSPHPRSRIGEPRAEAYRQVAPLPGGPLWRQLAVPAHLLLYLDRHGCDAVRHWRVRPTGEEVYRLGENLTYVFAKPEDIAPEVLEEIALLVLAAGKVKPQWLRFNLANAYLVSYASEEGVIVGTDTLKRLRPEYVASLKEQSGLDLTGYTERGYISIRPEYRGTGVSNALVRGVIARSEGRKMIIITGQDNLPGQKLLARNGQRLALTYYSKRLDKPMQIWMPRDQDPELGEES